MNKSKLINLTMPVFFIVFSIWIIATTMPMKPSEATFPRMVGVFTLAVALYQFYVDYRKDGHKDKFTGSNVLMVLQFVAVLFAYIFLFKKIGYIIDTLLLSLYTMIALGYKNYKVAAICSVALTLGVFFVFKLLLRVPLPMIFFDF